MGIFRQVDCSDHSFDNRVNCFENTLYILIYIYIRTLCNYNLEKCVTYDTGMIKRKLFDVRNT